MPRYILSGQFNRALRLAGRGLVLTFGSLAVLLAAGLLIMRAQGNQLLSVQTGSMEPVLQPGDAVVVHAVSTRQLRVGDIISYQSPRDSSLIISHRLIGIDRRTGWLRTQGDALKTPDPAFPPRLVVGQVTAVAPKLGRLLDILRQPLGLALAVYLPAIVIIVAEIRRLIDHYRRRYYRMLGYRYAVSRRSGRTVASN